MRYDPATDYDADDYGRPRGGGYWWLWVPLIMIFVGSLALSVAAYQTNEVTITEALIAGFVGVGGLMVGLVAGFFGLVVGLIGGAIGLLTAGGVVAVTLFVLASPVLALVLLFLLLRRSKECPDPSAHGEYDA